MKLTMHLEETPSTWTSQGVDRRKLLMAVGAAALTGCAATPRLGSLTQPRPVMMPVHVSADRVIRVVTGLRPFRPAGFVVRGESLGAKRLVHNYGHGGAGVTLSWGSAELALEQGFDAMLRDYAVLGCGALGLATARLLQRRGAGVTIYAAQLPPDTTSNVAGAQWWPSFAHDHTVVDDAYRARLLRAATLSSRQFQLMLGPRYGVRWLRNYQVAKAGEENRFPVPADNVLAGLAFGRRSYAAGEHPFGDAVLHSYESMLIEPSIYLEAVLRDFRDAGGRVVVRRFETPGQLASLPEPVVFNCTGFGAAALFGDAGMVPVKGQLVVLPPQPEVDYALFADGPTYMFSRSDGIVLGGTVERGIADLAPDPATTRRIVESGRALFATRR